MRTNVATDSMGIQRRSNCPMNFITELLGDKWSLLIIRDILLNDKHSFVEFLDAEEGIARNILTDRLKQLEQNGLITKSRHPHDGRKELYTLTNKGKNLGPVLSAMSEWSFENEPTTKAFLSNN